MMKTIPVLIFLFTAVLYSQSYTYRLDLLVNYVVETSSNEDYSTNSQFISALNVLNPYELRLVRNAIFAKHGYNFKSDDLSQFYKKFDWYKSQDSTLNLVDLEKSNIKTINEIEESKKAQFANLVKKFKMASLPILLHEGNLDDLLKNQFKLNINERQSFIMSDEEIYFRLERKTDYGGSYYGCFRIDFSDVVILCFLYSGLAGGYDDHFYLVTYSPDGKFLSKKEIANFIGSAEGKTTGFVSITPNLNIFVEKTNIELDDFGNVKNKQVTKQIYNVNNEGYIK